MLHLVVKLYARKGWAWRPVQLFALPLVMGLWVYYWLTLRSVAGAWLRRQSHLRAAWRRERDDRLRHPQDYRCK